MTSVQDLFAQGSHAFADEDFEEAINLYTKAIQINASHVEIFLKRYEGLDWTGLDLAAESTGAM